jgi:methionyl-tRNA formyltransferase
MRVVFMGTPDFSVPVLDALVDAGHDIVAVYCQPPRPAGRGKKDRPTPVHQRAEELGLDVRHPLNFKAEESVAEFADLKADIAVVVAYGLILPQVILDAPKQGCLNIHASLLPRWRGAAPIHRAIMAGDKATGVCIMQMEAGLDTGPVLLRKETDILLTDTTLILHDRLAEIGSSAIVEALGRLDQLTPVVQSEDGVTYAKKIEKAEAQIDWTGSAEEVDRHIRGLSPFPGAWFADGDQRVKVLMSHVVQGAGEAGEIIDQVSVACGSGAVALTRLQRAGKGAMDADVFTRGYPLANGTRL